MKIMKSTALFFTTAMVMSMVIFATTMTAYADAYLVREMTGDDVAGLQRMLIEAGYLETSGLDGYYGAYTEDAVRRYQKDHGLYVDGEAGPHTLGVLEGEVGRLTTFQSDPAASAVSEDIDLTNVYLRQGDISNAVIWLQQKLTSLGYYNRSIDGYYGPYTLAAVQNYQQDQGLYVDGEAGPISLQALGGVINTAPVDTGYTAPVQVDLNNVYLRQGDTSDSVAWLQQQLASLGYYGGSIDGYYGPYTLAAVQNYQRDQGLYVDGEAGPYTLAAISGNNNLIPTQVISQERQLAQNVLNEVGWDLKNAYDLIVNSNFSSAVTGSTVSSAATAFFQNGAGDCTAKASAFAVMARELGFDCKVVTGYIPYTNGTMAEHSWTEIKINGITYVCDPDFEWELKRNGYFISYGDSGTWVYQNWYDYPE